jgi:hypothetical protein
MADVGKLVSDALTDGGGEIEGLSYCVFNDERFTLRDAVSALKGEIVGDSIWKKYSRWPVYSKFFDNMGPIPYHMHQNDEQAKLVRQEGKPESYYFPPQMNAIGNIFPYTFMGLEPGTTKAEIVNRLNRWNEGDNGILNYSKAYRLQPGTGWVDSPVRAARTWFISDIQKSEKKVRSQPDTESRPMLGRLFVHTAVSPRDLWFVETTNSNPL